MKGKIVHIEIPAEDTERAMKFWGELAGWQFKNYSEDPTARPSTTCSRASPAARSIRRGKARRASWSTSRPMTSMPSSAGFAMPAVTGGEDAGPEHGLVRGREGPGGQCVLRLAER